jgi:Ig-fold domain
MACRNLEFNRLLWPVEGTAVPRETLLRPDPGRRGRGSRDRGGSRPPVEPPVDRTERQNLLAGHQAWRIRAGAADISAHEGSARTGVLGMYRADADLLVWLEAIEGATVLARNLVLFARPKHLDLHPPGISWTIAADGTGSRIAIRAARPALWVHLHAGDARFSDNWFHLDGRQERHLTSPVAPAELQAALTVRSLVDRG